PLESVGVLDPTSAAKNYHVKSNCETRLRNWAVQTKHILITGHTHRPVMPEEPAYYYNTGSCVHPSCITCIEVERGRLTLVKWSMQARPDLILYVEREVIGGPVQIL
ncbi:MAG: serine/threonine protein phosphatase, partial [Lachnospiraceae bacterium]|nr:serine/threonine protein phosphatase [Lachnospiraceae bacterium]